MVRFVQNVDLRYPAAFAMPLRSFAWKENVCFETRDFDKRGAAEV